MPHANNYQVIELEIADKQAKAEKTKTGAKKVTAFFKRIWKKVLPYCSGEPKVNDDEEETTTKGPVDPFHDLFESLETGYQTSVTFELEEEILKERNVRDLFSTTALENSQLRWDFNAIIGIQMAIWRSFQSSPCLKEALQQASNTWRKSVRVTFGEVNRVDVLAIKKELKNKRNVYKEQIEKCVSSKEIKTKLTEDELSGLRDVLQLKIAMDVLLMVVPEKHVAMFVLLLNYYEGENLKKFQEVAYKRIMDKKAENSEPQTSSPSKPQSSTPSEPQSSTLSTDFIFKSLDAGQKLSEHLKLMGKVLEYSLIGELINSDTFDGNKRLKWCLESLIGIEAAIGYFKFKTTSTQKMVFESAVEVLKTHYLNPSFLDEKTPEDLMKKVTGGSTEPVIQEIIKEAPKKRKRVLEIRENKEVFCYLELRMSVYIMFSIVPENERRLLKLVFNYFERGLVIDDIVEVLKKNNFPFRCNEGNTP